MTDAHMTISAKKCFYSKIKDERRHIVAPFDLRLRATVPLAHLPLSLIWACPGVLRDFTRRELRRARRYKPLFMDGSSSGADCPI